MDAEQGVVDVLLFLAEAGEQPTLSAGQDFLANKLHAVVWATAYLYGISPREIADRIFKSLSSDEDWFTQIVPAIERLIDKVGT